MNPNRLDDDGFALIDALTALMVLSTTIGFALSATTVARRISAAAYETRRASAVLSYVLEAPIPLGDSHGSVRGFDWKLDVQPDQLTNQATVRVCRRNVTVRSSVTGRAYTAATLQPCPSDGRL